MNHQFDYFSEKKKIFINSSSEDEDVQPFSLIKGEEIKITINEKLFKFFLFLSFLFIFLIFIRLFSLQIIKGDYWLKVAEEKKLRVEEIIPNRGIIYDRNMYPLVRNVISFSLYLDYKKIPKEPEKRKIFFEKLEKIIGQDKLSFIDFDKKESPILIKENLSFDEVVLLEIEKDSLDGIILETKKKRKYLGGQEFSHLLGYLGKVSKEEQEMGYSLSDEIGKTGLEKYYQNELAGKKGKRMIEPKGKEEYITAIEPAVDGKSLVLTIDFELQKKFAFSLEKWIKFSGAKKGAGVILSPKNGEILAMVSFPFFDNNLFSFGISAKDFEKIASDPLKPLFNRAISGEYPPGSTIKPVIALAALEEGIIDEKTTIMSTGGIKVGKWFFSDWKKQGHGQTNLKKALAESVNTFFYLVAGGSENFSGLGIEKILFYLKMFGLGEKTGIDLPYEKKGFLPSEEWKKKTKNEDWFIGDTYNLSIGHGEIKVTPLQMAILTAGIASDGKIFKPKIVKKILKENETDNLKESFSILPIKKENFKLVKEGLREAVISGTARRLKDLSISVAGKTGTVEVKGAKPHSWFTCFAPYDQPEIVIVVIIENGGEGSGPALSVAKEVLEWWTENRYNK